MSGPESSPQDPDQPITESSEYRDKVEERKALAEALETIEQLHSEGRMSDEKALEIIEEFDLDTEEE